MSSALSKVDIGLGWDPVSSGSGGFFGKLMGGDSSIDLDASCILLDANNQLIENVWFMRLQSKCRSVVHHGDNLTGEGDGDDEVITVNLTQLPANVSTLAFTVNSFRGQTFNQVANAFCRVLDSNRKELARYNLTEQGSHTGVFIASLSRNHGDWTFKAHGVAINGRTVKDMIPQIKRELSQ
ncbi:TerD family protein [Limnobaculum parvum]|nr:TerD family protein [Limnobaculum parvum]